MDNPSILDCDLFDLADRLFDAYPEAVPFDDFEPYRILEPIGRGGMGEVFLAEDITAGRRVAIKFLRHIWSEPDLPERFRLEIRTLAGLEHPFIGRLYDYGVRPDGTSWFAMEYVEGKPIDQYCREHDCSLEERLRLFRAVCDAVQYAHGRAVIHLDLKPSNILVKEDGTPKLLDFGIAKHLENPDTPAKQTQLRFTPAFAAPEQILQQPLGTYTDVYALGVVLYELLAQKPPYDLENRAAGETDAAIVSDREPERPSLTKGRVNASKSAWRDLDVLCLMALKKDVQRRYRSVVELIQDVDHYLQGEPLKARPDAWGYRLGKFASRNRRPIAAVGLVLMIVLGLVVFFTVRLAKARNEAEHESAVADAMNRFLSDDLLGRSDPLKTGSAGELFVDAVNSASPDIDVQFAKEPVLAARLHQTLARAFDNRSDFPQARREYDRAIDLFLKGAGPSSEDAIVARLQRAALEARSYQPGSLPLAKAVLGDAERAISKIAKPTEQLTVWDLWARGNLAMRVNDAKIASADFSAALQRAQAIPSIDADRLRKLKQLLGASYIHLSDGPKAERLFRDLIRSSKSPDSPETLLSRIYLSQALLIQGKYSEVIKETNIIYPALVRTLGEDHERTLSVLGTRAVSEGSLGLYDDAIRDDLTVYKLAVKKLGPVSMYSIEMLADAAQSQCKVGRYVEGESNARRAFQEAKKAFGTNAGITGGCSYSLATCLIGMNRLDEAAQLLQNIDVSTASQASGDSAAGASIALAQGEIALRRGNYALAERYARIAAPVFDRPGAAMPDRQQFEKLVRGIEAHTSASKGSSSK